MAKDKSSKNNAPIEWKKSEQTAAREILLSISSARTYGDLPEDNDIFLRGSSVINSDLTHSAHSELDGMVDDQSEEVGLYQLVKSPMFWRLRDSFVEEAEKGSKYAFVRAVWRAYNAGLMSPRQVAIPDIPRAIK